MQLELLREQVDRRIVKLKESVPFENAGFPERHGQRNPQHELNEPRLRELLDQPFRRAQSRI